MNAAADHIVLRLHDLSEGIPALTPALGTVHAEAASVCLAACHHPLETELHLPDLERVQASIVRGDVDDQMSRAYNDLQKTTELGAVGVAILLVRQLFDLTVIQQSRKGTGFDYWVGPQTTDGLVFQNTARLEVSGILRGDDSQFRTRVKQKLRQSSPSDETRLPAYAAVVEFSRPQAEVARQ
jgi:hypothetical protein